MGPDGKVTFESREELPPVTISFSTTAWNRTGAWRSREPFFTERHAPCTRGCPAGEDVVEQLRFVAQGRLDLAGELVLRSNPFPATTGRVCPHPCTDSCNRAPLDGAVDIPGVEREIGDALLRSGYRPESAPRNGRKVAVVGAGPAGLSASWHLVLSGFEVDLYDREDRPGGLLWSGIPPYRLPREVLEGEIRRALDAGIRFRGGVAFGRDLHLEALRQGYDGVVLAVGLHASRGLGVPGEEAEGVVDGLRLLHDLHLGRPAPAGDPAFVIGGGNTAMDCARSLRREGREVVVAYRRDRAAMPAFADEVEEAVEEGVRIEEWLAPAAVLVVGGRATGVRFLRTRPGAPDRSGRPRPEPVEGSEHERPAGLVVVAAGESLDRVSLPAEVCGGWSVVADAEGGTNLTGVWACGDCTGDGGTVSIAIGRGRRVAASICARFGVAGPVLDLPAERGAGEETAGPERIRARYFPAAPTLSRGRIDVADRVGAGEVRRGFGPERACLEAARCLSCGTCTGCDNCYVYCPDQAVLRTEPGRYEVIVTRCKGCGVCVEECPRGAIELRAVGEADGHEPAADG